MPRLRSRAALTAPSAAPTASSTRPRRGTANQQQAPSAAVIQRSSPEDTRQSIHLTVKASPNKLRTATSGSISKTSVSSRNIVSGKRASRNSRIIQEVDTSDEAEEEEDDDVQEADVMDVDDEEEESEEDADAEGELDDEIDADVDADVDADGELDDEMEDVTPAPRIVVSTTETVKVKPVSLQPVAQDTVEAKEMAMADDDDDDELSELDSDEEDAEGEDLDAEGEDEELDEDMDSDGTPGSMSRSHTPDLSKMTRRQRALVNEDSDGALLALSNEAQKKKHLTAEEHAMRRAEMARRRKNLSEKRNEEEKMDTINRLLKKQPPKRGRRVIQDLADSGQEDEPEVEKAPPLYVRYTQNASGAQLAIPEEWLEAPAGSIFTGDLAPASLRPYGRRMVEEVS
ncbi:hypothetical protein EJ04DRAFT_112638 [Polyplosphaeria fusca]|uniref:INO80 complex subunit B-like conserved region domain-containing protein n=1 Tax=Polyplosphaeria fusca TaxID=682080 RepID=A0A9P4RCN1_9PLEO|nr:hypothetical protein EJ04DRAFT_112638 [Polyplosphaeria fusca]